MVDEICARIYGDESMTVAVYEANPGLAERGAILPAGLAIILPEQAPAPVRSPIRLWGNA